MANPYVHLSFDLWNTLIVANPAYTASRTEYLSQRFRKTPAEVKAIYTGIKHFADGIAEKMGGQYSTTTMYKMLLTAFDASLKPEQMYEIRCAMEFLFCKNPPRVSEELIEAIQTISVNGCSIGILSNTNFISGEVIRDSILSQFPFEFDTALFSDEHPVAKPNRAFFQAMKTEVFAQAQRKFAPEPKLNQIAHIGDNLICDGEGAQAAGVSFIHVERPSNTIDFLKAMYAY